MEFDPTGDFECIVDGLKPVTVSNRIGSTFADVQSLRRQVTTREAKKSNGKYDTNDSVFHVSSVAVTEKMVPGSTLVDSTGTIWTILETQFQTLTARWRYIVRDLKLTGDLNDVVFHEIATFTKGPSGEQVPTWVPTSPDTLNARFQPTERRRETEYSTIHAAEIWIGYFAVDFEVDSNHRFIAIDDNRIYQPIKVMDRESITDLMAVECEVIPWPQN